MYDYAFQQFRVEFEQKMLFYLFPTMVVPRIILLGV